MATAIAMEPAATVQVRKAMIPNKVVVLNCLRAAVLHLAHPLQARLHQVAEVEAAVLAAEAAAVVVAQDVAVNQPFLQSSFWTE
jgi:DMSO reductase anchor subunit